MPKNTFLYLAIIWTTLIFFVCFAKSSDVPTVNIVGIDKVAHFLMHFSFTFLWGMAFYKGNFISKTSLVLVFSFLLSFVFGVIIEIFQGYLTVTRSADSEDVLANIIGALLAISILSPCFKAFKGKQ